MPVGVTSARTNWVERAAIMARCVAHRECPPPGFDKPNRGNLGGHFRFAFAIRRLMTPFAVRTARPSSPVLARTELATSFH